MCSLFRGALWSYEGRLLVNFRKEGTIPESSVWLDKMQKKFTNDSLKIQVFMKEFELKTLFPKIYIFSTPRAGARVFVQNRGGTGGGHICRSIWMCLLSTTCTASWDDEA